MRLTREDLLDRYPTWNEQKHDIVQAFYGDIPLVEWNEKEYARYCELTGTLANVEAVDAYIYIQNGPYRKYCTLIGDIYTKDSGEILCGDLRVKYRGKAYNIYLNLMYGRKALSIFRITGSEILTGFSNKYGMRSPCMKAHTKELDEYVIEDVLKVNLSDYGECVQRFMKEVKSLYEENKVNYIMEGTR